MVTLFLISILMGLVVPHLGFGQLESIRTAANRFRNVLIWLRDQGSYGLESYRLRLDLPHNTYYCEMLRKESFIPVEDPLLKPGILHPGDGHLIWQPDKTDLPDFNEVIVPFNTFGPAKAIMVQFTNREGNDGFTVSYRPEWSKPRVEQGLLSWE